MKLKFIIFIMLNFSLCAMANNNPLGTLIFKDQGLTECFSDLIQKNNWNKINDVTKIQCHGMKIKSIDGLEQFTSLTFLSLYNNQLTTADLTKLSRLQDLNLANNRLSNVNISHLTQLETLYLFKNKLTYIDFSGLKSLKKLRITNNLLANIDITPLAALQMAYFFDNKLADLKLTGLDNLTFLELRQNPMPDEVYDLYDEMEGITIIHDGNADDWK